MGKGEYDLNELTVEASLSKALSAALMNSYPPHHIMLKRHGHVHCRPRQPRLLYLNESSWLFSWLSNMTNSVARRLLHKSLRGLNTSCDSASLYVLPQLVQKEAPFSDFISLAGPLAKYSHVDCTRNHTLISCRPYNTLGLPLRC